MARIRLKENQLRRIIKESVKNALSQKFDFYNGVDINVESIREIYEIARDIFGIDSGERQKTLRIRFHYKGFIVELQANCVPDGLFWSERAYIIRVLVWNEGGQRPNYTCGDLSASTTGYKLDYSKLKNAIKDQIGYVSTRQS